MHAMQVSDLGASLYGLAVSLDALAGTLVGAQSLLLKVVDTVNSIPVIGSLLGASNEAGQHEWAG